MTQSSATGTQKEQKELLESPEPRIVYGKMGNGRVHWGNIDRWMAESGQTPESMSANSQSLASRYLKAGDRVTVKYMKQGCYGELSFTGEVHRATSTSLLVIPDEEFDGEITGLWHLREACEFIPPQQKTLNSYATHLRNIINQYGQPDWSASEFLAEINSVADALDALSDGIEQKIKRVDSGIQALDRIKSEQAQP